MVDDAKNGKHSGESGGGPGVKTLESLHNEHADPK